MEDVWVNQAVALSRLEGSVPPCCQQSVSTPRSAWPAELRAYAQDMRRGSKNIRGIWSGMILAAVLAGWRLKTFLQPNVPVYKTSWRALLSVCS